MRTEPLVVKDFKYAYLDVDVCLSFPDNLTFITGESATGKTFLYDIFYTAQSRYDYIRVFNFAYNSEDVFREIKEKKDKLFIIDNADIILTDELRRYIAFDFNNQYVIIGRNPSNLMLMKHQLCNIQFIDNVLSLRSLGKPTKKTVG